MGTLVASGDDVSGNHCVSARAIKDAPKGREVELLEGFEIDWNGGSGGHRSAVEHGQAKKSEA